MVLKAVKKKLSIKEIDIGYSTREGESKLRSFSDGWRHLRFMLLYAPEFLFFLPGILMFIIGFFSMIWFYLFDPEVFGITLFFHPMFLSSLLLVVGYQLIVFAGFAKSYSVVHLEEKSEFFELAYKYLTIERMSLFGIFLGLVGLGIFISILVRWISSDYGALSEVGNAIIALTLSVIGVQTIFSSFMLSIIGIRK